MVVAIIYSGEFSQMDDSDKQLEKETTTVNMVERGGCGNLKEKIISNMKSTYLKDLVLLQLNLIEEQQRKIIQKDKEFMILKQERDQFEARLKRMERRLSVHKSRTSTDGDDLSRLRSPVNRSSPYQQKKDGSKTVDKVKFIQGVPVTISSTSDKDFQFNKQMKTNTEFLHCADTLLCLNNTKCSSPTLDQMVSVPSFTNISSKERLKESDLKEEENAEDISDDAYLKRHSRPEQEEKRRKRWDLQVLRNQRQQEILIQKYQNQQASSSSCSEPSKQPVKTIAPYFTESLFRDASMAMAIEISNEIPVCAFGYHLPAVRERDFHLPWFNIEKKEIQLREAKQRLLKKQGARKRSSGKLD